MSTMKAEKLLLVCLSVQGLPLGLCMIVRYPLPTKVIKYSLRVRYVSDNGLAAWRLGLSDLAHGTRTVERLNQQGLST